MTKLGRGLRAFAFLLFLAASIYYLVQLWEFKDAVPAVAFDWRSLGVLLAGVFLVAILSGLGGWIWFLLLRDQRVSLAAPEALGIFAVAQFAKYLPGNVGHHVGRVVMAKSAGVPIPITLSTMLVEVLWGTGIAAGLGLLSLAWFVDESLLTAYWTFGAWQLGLFAALLLVLPWLGVVALNTFLPRFSRRLSGGGLIVLPKLSTASMVAAIYLGSFVIMGVILKSQALWLFGVVEGNVFELACVFAIAWLAGYLVPGAPGGLGVREAVMALTLSPILGEGAAVGLGVTLRITTMLGDGLAFLLGFFARRFSSPVSSDIGC